MFQSINFQGFEYNPDFYIFFLKDSEFICNVLVRTSSINTGKAVALVQEYGKRNLPVAKNLGIYYYLNFIHHSNIYNRRILFKAVWTHMYRVNKEYPDIEFDKKYSRCIINQLKLQAYCHNVSI